MSVTIIENACCCGGIPTECCENSVPAVLTVTITGIIDGCTCSGVDIGPSTFTVTYDDIEDKWIGIITGTTTITIKIWCEFNNWRSQPFCDGAVANSPSNLTLQSCSPFELTGGGATLGVNECDCINCDNLNIFPTILFNVTE